jgi:N-acetylmuramoyl-L-alanine amidase
VPSLDAMSVERRLILRRIAQTAVGGGVAALSAASALNTPPSARPRELTRHSAPAGGQWTAARPTIVSRAHWDTDVQPKRRPLPPARYAATLKAVFVHHTDSGNHYRPGDVPEIVSGIRRDQTTRLGWDDIGYNFLVARDGTIYEGRHGGIDKPVEGAHTRGFNRHSVGIAAIGTFGTGTTVPRPMVDAIAHLVAWKLGLYAIDPRAMATLTCTNRVSRYPKGAHPTLHTVSGHRDGDWTVCPGSSLYAMLPHIRAEAARLQGRTDGGGAARGGGAHGSAADGP